MVFVSICGPTAGCTVDETVEVITDDGATYGTIIFCIKNERIRQKRLKNIYKAIILVS